MVCCCFVCSCEKRYRSIGKPEGYPDAPRKIICPHCGSVASGEYKKHYTRFYFCFIPCCCKCMTSDPYLACTNCSNPLGVIQGVTCKKCDVLTPFTSPYCPSCGEKRDRL